MHYSTIQCLQDTTEYLFDMDHFSILYVHGNDAKKFLQGQLTCDIEQLNTSTAQPTACCNLQGRIVALFFIIPWDAGYLLIMPHAILPDLCKHFKKYAVFSKVIFEPYDTYRLIGFFESPLLDPHINSIYYCLEDLRIVLVPAAQITDFFAAYENTHTRLDANAWHYEQITRGFPDIYPHTSGMFLPHRIGLQYITDVLNFKKGCYLGQEIIARTHFKAHLKHVICLCKSTTAETMHAGDNLISHINHAEAIGEIIDIAKNTHYFLAAIQTAALPELPSNIQMIKTYSKH